MLNMNKKKQKKRNHKCVIHGCKMWKKNYAFILKFNMATVKIIIKQILLDVQLDRKPKYKLHKFKHLCIIYCPENLAPIVN